jgi:hypothetical protein
LNSRKITDLRSVFLNGFSCQREKFRPGNIIMLAPRHFLPSPFLKN